MPEHQMKRWKYLFYFAACYNLSAAIPALLSYSLNLKTFFDRNSVPEEFLTYFFYLGFWFSVLLFGIGYWLVAQNPHKNHGIIFLAIIGKLGVGVIFSWTYYMGIATLLLAIGGLGDIGFALAFIYFLSHYHPPKHIEQNN